jgi:hypothetical protein
MKDTPMLLFESSSFPIVPGEDEETNPGIYGKALAEWLTGQVRSAGYSPGAIIAEDFGWCIPIASEGCSVYVVCASTDETASEWRVFAFGERGLIARLSSRDTRAALLTGLFTALRRSLESAPIIRNLREEV